MQLPNVGSLGHAVRRRWSALIASCAIVVAIPTQGGDVTGAPAQRPGSQPVLILRLPPPRRSLNKYESIEKDSYAETTSLFIPDGANADSLIDSPAYWSKFPPELVVHMAPGARGIAISVLGDSATHRVDLDVIPGLGDPIRRWTWKSRRGLSHSSAHWNLRDSSGRPALAGTYTVHAYCPGREDVHGLILIGR